MAILLLYRDDSKAIGDRLSDNLIVRFKEENIIESSASFIQPGDDFVDAIEEGVQKVDGVIIVIGENWASGDWLNDSNDYNTIAINSAIIAKKKIVPVLANGASLPSSAELPENLQSLARRQGLELNDATFRDDAKVIGDSIQSMLPAPKPKRPAQTSAPKPAQPQNLGSLVNNPPPRQQPVDPFSGAYSNPYAEKSRTVAQPQLADTGRRFVALIIDGIILGIIGGIIGVMIPAPSTYDYYYQYQYNDAWNDWQLNLSVISLIVTALYYGYFLSQQDGQTLGKRAMKIKVIKKNGDPVGVLDALLRNILGYGLSSVVFLLGFIWAFFDADRQTWHDKIVNTIVVSAE